jgi:hypothetical protein
MKDGIAMKFVQFIGNTLLYVVTFCRWSSFYFILYGYKNPTLMFVAGERFFLKLNCKETEVEQID